MQQDILPAAAADVRHGLTCLYDHVVAAHMRTIVGLHAACAVATVGLKKGTLSSEVVLTLVQQGLNNGPLGLGPGREVMH